MLWLRRLSLYLILLLTLLFAQSPQTTSANRTFPRGTAPGVAGGAGTPFVDSGQALGGETGNRVASGDLDGDGDVDALVANDYSEVGAEGNQIWLNDGAGFFSQGDTLGDEDGEAVALGDLDGDADLDAIIATPSPTSARVWVNQGGAQAGLEGNFLPGVAFGSTSGYGIALGDVDQDGDLDALVVGNSNQIWLNNGGATFTAGPLFPFLYSESTALADLDEDGWLDVLIADSADGDTSRVWWNEGSWEGDPGTFTPGELLPASGLVHSLATADLDGDLRPDIFLAGSGQDQIYWNEGDRTFDSPGPLAASDNSFDVALQDIDGDDDVDAVVANISADPNRVWRNDGERIFTIAQEFGDETSLYWSRGLALADLNGDGTVDLFEVTTAEDRVWLNQTVPPLIPNAPGWQVQEIDVRGRAGLSPSLALDPDGHPSFSYVRVYEDETQNNVSYLTYARWDGVQWRSEIVRTNVGSESALAVDSDGVPHIAYTNENGRTLAYARRVGAEWQMATIDTVSFPSTIALGSLALSADGRPHISYNTFNNGSPNPEHLKMAWWNGSTWTVETVENGLVYDSELAVDAGGRPHLAYAIRASFDQYVLKYAVRSGTSWEDQVLDGEADNSGVFLASLSLDEAGSPHIGYVLDGFVASDVVKHVYHDGNSWQYSSVTTISPGAEVLDAELQVGATGNAHLVYFLSDQPGYRIEYGFGDRQSWTVTTLAGAAEGAPVLRANLVGLALDSDDTVHIGYHEARFDDLRYITWALAWQLRPLPIPGLAEIPAVTVSHGSPSIAYYIPGSGQVQLAQWQNGWMSSSVDFVSQAVTDLSTAAGPQFEHISYYDADAQRLIYGIWDGTTWTREIVDEAGSVGRYNDLALAGHSDGAPLIAYWDDTTLRIKLARPIPNSVAWNIYPNLAGPDLDSTSGPLSVTPLPGGAAVSYYDGARADLRVALWSIATGGWTDTLVAGLTGDAGRLNSIQTDWTDEVPVVAYYDEENNEIRLAHLSASGWQQGTAVRDADDVTSLALELGFNSRHQARIAFTTGDGALYVAIANGAQWVIEEVESGGNTSEVASARDNRLHLAYRRGTSGLQYAFRTATLDFTPARPLAAAPPGYNPLDPCHDDLSIDSGGRLIAGPSAISGSGLSREGGELDDMAVFGGMTWLFDQSEAGKQYIEQYHLHGSEMGQIGLDNPQLLVDAYGTLQNFLPGLEALVTGQGEEIIVTQQMVDDAVNIWQRLATEASPALASAIDMELEKYDNLQDFVGLTFNEWAETIGVTPPPETLWLPVVQR